MTLRTLTCSCGGTLRLGTLRSYDLAPEAGLPVTLGEVRGYRCARCARETLPAAMAERALLAVAVALIAQAGRLAAAEGRYLRRHLGTTQAELAERMGIARETLARWESGAEEISPQHDHILRAFVLADLVARGYGKAAEGLGTALASVRRRPPAKRPRIASSAVARYMAALTPRRAA